MIKNEKSARVCLEDMLKRKRDYSDEKEALELEMRKKSNEIQRLEAREKKIEEDTNDLSKEMSNYKSDLKNFD